ncbi:MAG: DUF2000 domain-containing protein [Labedaea sp.]
MVSHDDWVVVDEGVTPVGWAPDQVKIDQPTRESHLKWIIAVNRELPPGVAANAVACLAAAVGNAVPGVIGPAGKDAAGRIHPGLPWAGCSILAGSAEQLADLRHRSADVIGVFVCDMPSIAHTTRIYADFLDRLAAADPETLVVHAISVIGPRSRVDRLARRLSLLR